MYCSTDVAELIDKKERKKKHFTKSTSVRNSKSKQKDNSKPHKIKLQRAFKTTTAKVIIID